MATYYLDTSATNDGDGTAHGQAGSPGGAGAWNTLVSKSLSSGDVVWCRRTSTSGSEWSASITLTTANVSYIGWPLAGDEFYASRPSGAQGDWDGDAATHSTWGKYSTTNRVFTSVGQTTGTKSRFHRINFYSTAQQTTPSFFTATGPSGGSLETGTEFVSCRWEHIPSAGTPSTSNVTITNACSFVLCDFHLNNRGTGSGVCAVRILNPAASDVYLFQGCTFTLYGTSTGIAAHTQGHFDFSLGNATAYLTLRDCTFTLDPTVTDSGCALASFTCTSSVTTNGIYLERVTFDATNANDDDLKRVYFNASCLRGSQVRFLNTTFAGTSVTQQFDSLEIQEWSEAAINAAQTFNVNGLLSINKCTRYASNVSAFTLARHANAQGSTVLLARGVVWPVLPTLLVAPGTRGNVLYSIDHQGNVGDWYAQQNDMRCQTSSVSRDGATAYSLKFETIGGSSHHHRFLQVGLPELETILLNLSTGSQTLTLYGAHKSFTNAYSNAPTKAHVWIEVRYLDGSSYRALAHTLPTTSRFDALASDSSTWTGDTGLTSFKIATTFTVGTAGLASVRLFAGWPNGEGGIVYLDPTPVVS